MSDMVLGKTNKANNGTELVGGTLDEDWGGNDYIFHVVGGNISPVPGPVAGIRSSGFGGAGVHGIGGPGILGNGQTGVKGEGGDIGVEGQGNHRGVQGLLTGATVPGNWDIYNVAVLGSAADANDGNGVMGISDNFDGTVGSSQTSNGVHGLSTSGTGVMGECDAGTGVHGRGGPFGVVAEGSSFGVLAAGTQIGVVGQGPVAGATGVLGQGTIGVMGSAISGIGVYAQSVNGFGLYAEGGGPFGAVFLAGDVIVSGNFQVFGALKSAAVPHPDGSHRLLYSLECPESWFEDFGEGKLVNGKAEVKLDPDFAVVVKSKHYHVFVTPYGDSHGLYVAKRTDKGFEVMEQQGGKSSVEFSYRVVAKRKDIEGERLKKVTLPPAPPKPPQEPELPSHMFAHMQSGKR